MEKGSRQGSNYREAPNDDGLALSILEKFGILSKIFLQRDKLDDDVVNRDSSENTKGRISLI